MATYILIIEDGEQIPFAAAFSSEDKAKAYALAFILDLEAETDESAFAKALEWRRHNNGNLSLVNWEDKASIQYAPIDPVYGAERSGDPAA